MSGYFDALNGIKKAIADGKITIVREGNDYTVSGDTYAHKGFIKGELEASWDKDAKVWRTVDARQGVIDKYDELMPEPEQPAEPEQPETVTLNDDGTINLSNGAVLEMAWDGGDIDVTVYGTPEAAAHGYGWNHRLFADDTRPEAVAAWMVERGVTGREAVEAGKLFANIAAFHA